MANLTETKMFKRLNSQTEMYDANHVDLLVNGLSATYAKKDNVYTKGEADGKFATKDDISSVYHFRGSVETYQELKTKTGMGVGDVYNVDESGKNYAWTGVTSAYDDGWDVLGGTFDLSDYYTKDEADDLLSGKVDKVEGMGLSHNDFTDAYVEKLDVIPSGAQENVIETITVDGIALPVTEKTVEITLSGKVDKVEGMGLSHNDFTDEALDKLNGAFQTSGGYINGDVYLTGAVSVDSQTATGRRTFSKMDADEITIGYTSGGLSSYTTYSNGYISKKDVYAYPYAIQLPDTSGTLALVSYVDAETSKKAEKAPFSILSSLQLVDVNNFDVEGLAMSYNTLVTILSGIVARL